MKMRLLTGLIAATFFSQAASAVELSSGSISNQTTATADVEFSQPITLENTLTPIAGLQAGKVVVTGDGDANYVQVANGSLAIKNSGVTALLAVKAAGLNGVSVVYADGHEGDGEYALGYVAVPKDTSVEHAQDKYNSFESTSAKYLVSPTATSKLDYKVLVVDSNGTAIKPGKYTFSSEGAIYNP